MTQWPLFFIISLNLVASGAHCVKVVEDVIIKKFLFAISSPDKFLVIIGNVMSKGMLLHVVEKLSEGLLMCNVSDSEHVLCEGQ